MKKQITSIGALAFVVTLSACGQAGEPADNAVANADVNTMMHENAMAMEAMPMNEPATATPAPTSEPNASHPPAAPKAPTKTAPAPAKPKPAEPAPDPHAGHDMNNMQ